MNIGRFQFQWRFNRGVDVSGVSQGARDLYARMCCDPEPGKSKIEMAVSVFDDRCAELDGVGAADLLAVLKAQVKMPGQREERFKLDRKATARLQRMLATNRKRHELLNIQLQSIEKGAL